MFANLDGDDDEELVVALSDGSVHAYQPDGTELAGFPTRTGLRRGLDPEHKDNGRGGCAYREDKADCEHKIGRLFVEHFVVQRIKRIFCWRAFYFESLYGDGFAMSPLAGQKVSAACAAID